MEINIDKSKVIRILRNKLLRIVVGNQEVENVNHSRHIQKRNNLQHDGIEGKLEELPGCGRRRNQLWDNLKSQNKSSDLLPVSRPNNNDSVTHVLA